MSFRGTLVVTFVLAACSFSIRASLAQQVEITVSGPTVVATSVQNATTETFNSFAPGIYSSLKTAVGTLTTGNSKTYFAIQNADEYGGAGGTGDYAAIGTEAGGNDAESATLTFSSPESYVGMWWSACDAGNVLSVYSGPTLLTTLNESSLAALIAGETNPKAYNGDPSGGNAKNSFTGQDYGEQFAYLNFYGLAGDNITGIVITEDRSVQNAGFEFDNVSAAPAYTAIVGSQIVVPEPNEVLILIIGTLMLFGIMVRQRATF